MKKILNIVLVAAMVVATSTTSTAQKGVKCKKGASYSYLVSLLESVDNCQEIGEGVLNQLAKADEYYRSGECKKAQNMMRVIENTLMAKYRKAQRTLAKDPRDRCARIAHKRLYVILNGGGKANNSLRNYQ